MYRKSETCWPKARRPYFAVESSSMIRGDCQDVTAETFGGLKLFFGDCVGWRLPLLAAKQGRRLVHTPYSATRMQGWCCFFVALGMIVR